MKRTTAGLLLCLTACGSAMRGGEDGDPPPEPLRLCVENTTVAYGNITARAGNVRFDVMPGETVCKRLLTASPNVALRASTIGGGASGPQTYAATLQTAGYRCWRWRLSDSPASAADLGPCPSEFRDDDTAADSAGGAR
jgi:hypothetical protein